MNNTRRREAKAKRRERARRAARRRQLEADRCTALLDEAQWAWDGGDVPTARRLLDKLLRVRPNHQRAHEHLAELHFAAGRFEEGLAHYERLLQPPEWPPLSYQAAVASFRAGRFDRCRTLIDEFVRQTRRRPEFKLLRAMARTVRQECIKATRHAATRATGEGRPRAAQAGLFEDLDLDAPDLMARSSVSPRHPDRAQSELASAVPRATSRSRQAGPEDPTRSARGAPTPAGVPASVPDLPPFPEVAVPEVRVQFEVDRGSFPQSVATTDIAPVREVLLRRDYTALRLQKGFDQLLSLGAVRDVSHFRYQLETVRRVLRDFRGRVLLADEVGLGKTIEACLALKEYWMRGLVRKALILTPPSLVGQWVEELTYRFALTPVTPESPAFRQHPDEFWAREPLVVASLALARQPAHRDRLSKIDYDLVIVDEAHVLKNRASAAWQLVNDLKKRFLMLLSATPVGNNLSELYNLVLLLRPGLLKTEAQFRRDYGRVQALEDLDRREKLRALLREVMVRNTRAHIDLKLPRRLAATQVVRPEAAEADVLASLSAVVRDRYPAASAAERWRLMMLQMQAGSSPSALRYGLRDRDTGVELDGFAPIVARLDRVGVSAKTTTLIDLARRSAEKKIVFTRFRATLAELEQALAAEGFRVAVFHGGLTASEKDAAIGDFQERAEILLSSEIGGEGRNLQFCRTVINYDLPWNPAAIEQRVGRVHRIGQTREVYVFNFCLAGSVEEQILRILHDKINLFELVAGEIEMILGELDEEQDFASLVMDVWARSSTRGEEARAFEQLSEQIVLAKTRYQKTRELDRALFSQDYEV